MSERAVPTKPASIVVVGPARARVVFLNLALALGYWALAELTLLPALPSGGRVTPMWPPIGLAVAAVLLGGLRLLPGIALGSFLTLVVRAPVWVASTSALGAVVETVVDVTLLRQLDFDPRLERVRDVLRLGILVAPAGALASASLGATATFMAGQSADFVSAFVLWWFRDWLGVQIVASVILTWARSRKRGPTGIATLVAVLATAALAVAALDYGPFSVIPLGFTQGFLHLFLLFGSLSGQTLAAFIMEREEATARRLALEEQLRHAQKMEAVGRLAGGIAHDFNNLLTAIIGYAELLMVGFDPKDGRRRDAEEIKRAAERAAELTRQMLAFSRRQVLQPAVVDVNAALQKVEPMFRRVLGEDIVVTVDARAARPSVRVDPGQFEQVIMNLVVNARDAMPKGGRLTVETGNVSFDQETLPPGAAAGDYVMVSVIDTGIGMSSDVRARIFEPYFTTKEVGKGTGLGLSTAYGIIQQSGGFIHVYSEPGKGTTFRVYLPCSDVAEAPAASAPEDMPRGTEHVLLIEDDPSVRRSTRETLIRLGYSVTEAASGRAGLALGSDDTRHFDVALCDVVLGDMSGPAVYEALRALRPGVRVLYMSGYADEAIVRTGVLEEGHAFLQKPFTPRDLAVKMREVLNGSHT